MLRAGPHSYTDTGTGPPLVCLHGIGGDDRAFAGLAPLLPDARTIAWNLPGYRASVPLPDLTFETLTAALADFLDRLGLDSVTLVGHSLGGMLALDASLRLPDRVDRLVLIATTPSFGGRDPGFAEAFLAARLGPLDAGQTMAQMGREAAPSLVAPGTDAATLAAVARTIADTPETTWRAALNCLTSFNRRADLARIDQPCLVIAGGHDTNAPARTMEKMAEALPDAAFACLAGAGHMIPLEAPDRTAALIAGFLEETA